MLEEGNLGSWQSVGPCTHHGSLRQRIGEAVVQSDKTHRASITETYCIDSSSGLCAIYDRRTDKLVQQRCADEYRERG